MGVKLKWAHSSICLNWGHNLHPEWGKSIETYQPSEMDSRNGGLTFIVWDCTLINSKVWIKNPFDPQNEIAFLIWLYGLENEQGNNQPD
jgi:hypothetical protein